MTIRGRHHLITVARHICVGAVLFSFLASAAWGQDAADLRIAALTKQLKQGDSFVRWRAAKALLKIGSYSKAEVPALIEAIKIEEGDISERARDALVKIGPDAVPALIKELTYRDSLAQSKAVEALGAIGAPAVPALIEALKDRDRDVRLGALEALSQISPKPEGAFPILIELMKDPDPAIRNAATQDITCCGAKAATAYLALIEALKDQDPNVRATAAFKFCGVRLAPEHPAVQPALALLLETLNNRDASVRSGAAQVLAYLGSTAKPALEALINASKDPDVKVRSSAAMALGKIEPAADPVLTALMETLRDPDKTVRSAAASALKSAPARAAIYPLILALQDREASVRRSAADSLARPDAGFAVPRLIQLMSDRDTEVRNAASRALEAIGHNAGKALVKALKDQDANTRNGAALVLGKLDPREGLAAHLEALKDEDASVRSSAASALGHFAEGPEAKTVTTDLIEALKDRDASVRRSAAGSLGVSAYNQTIVPALIEALKDPVSHVRYAAALSIIRVHAEPKLVIPILVEELEDQDPAIRSSAAATLGSPGMGFVAADAKGAVPGLLELLEDRNLDVCKSAISALGNLGGQDPAVVPALIKLLKHWDRGIQDAATRALSSIGQPAVPLLLKLLIGQESALRIRSYYALLGGAGISEWVGALKSRNQELRSLVLEILEEIREGSTNSVQGPDPSVDPSRKYVFYRVMTGCGFENEGRTMFVGELDSGRSFPILASCVYLGSPTFLEYGGKYYLLVAEGDGGSSFWLYDMKANEFVIHAAGEINETKERGVFSYAFADDQHDTAIPAGNVTMKNLINRESPLRLLPRYPLHGLTLRDNTKVVHTFSECFQDATTPSEVTIIRKAGTKVFLVSKCDDGSYEIYYRGARGQVPKGSLKPTK